jgi:hypothetical protein
MRQPFQLALMASNSPAKASRARQMCGGAWSVAPHDVTVSWSTPKSRAAWAVSSPAPK